MFCSSSSSQEEAPMSTPAPLSTCPRCPYPIVETDAYTVTCAGGHTTLLRDWPAHTPPAATTAASVPATAAAAVPSPAPSSAPRPVRPVYRSADTITPRQVSWLWPGRIPFGKLTVIDGDPDKGKSFI